MTQRSARFPLTLTLILSLSLGACAASTPPTQTAQSVDPLENVQATQLFHDGQVLASRGDLVRAEQYIAAAIRQGYPQERALPLLLRVCISSSRLSAALHHATPYLRLHPEDHRLRWVVASVLIGLGHYDRARLELLRVLSSVPEHAEAHYLLGVLLRDEYGDEDAAKPHFEAHLRLARDGLHGAEVAAWLRERHTAELEDGSEGPVHSHDAARATPLEATP
jgi:tetratricopeptide (TPR) repeat protein